MKFTVDVGSLRATAIEPWQPVRYQVDAGQITQALANSERGLEILGAHAEHDSYTYGAALGARGLALLAARRGEAAAEASGRALQVLARAHGSGHERVLLARVQQSLALAFAGHPLQARQALAPVLETTAPRAIDWPDLPRHANGVLLRLAGRPAEALGEQRGALASIPEGPKAPWIRMRVLIEFGLDQLELGKRGEASVALEEALGLSRRLQAATAPERADALVGLGRARMSLGHPVEALPLLEEADASWRGFDPENRWAGEAALWLGECQAALGRDREAARSLSRAEKILARSPLSTDVRLVRLARKR